MVPACLRWPLICLLKFSLPYQAWPKGLNLRVASACLSTPGKSVKVTGWSWRWSQDVLGRHGLFHPSLARNGGPSQQATLELGAVNGVILGPQRKRGNQGLGSGELE